MAKPKNFVVKRIKSNKVGKTVAKIQDRKVYGNEPAVTPGIVITQSRLLHHLNWYNYMFDVKQARDYLETYLTSINDNRAHSLKKVTDKAIRQSAGWIARLLTLGAFIDNDTANTFDRLLDETFTKTIIEDVKSDSDDDKLVPDISKKKKRELNKVSDIIADIEDVMDEWYDTNFVLFNYLEQNKISHKLIQPVIDYYTPIRDEIELAVKGTDKDLKESYSHYTKNELNNYLRFISGIVSDLERYESSTKAAVISTRKPRVKKKISIDTKLQHLVYLPSFAPLQLKSIQPASIIGASEVFIYDTIYKRLTYLKAASAEGLDINRSTIVGFDETASGAKKIGRRTLTTIDGILRGNKVQARKVFNDIAGETAKASGRVGKVTILLKRM